MSDSVLIIPFFKTETLYFQERVDSIYLLGFPLKGHSGIKRPYEGTSRITGTVKINNILGERRVSLFERTTLAYIKSTQSDPITGEFEFVDLSATRKYIVIVDDNEQKYNAVIADWVKVDD